MSANGGNGGGTRTVGGGGGGGGRIAIISRNVNKLNTTFDAYGGKLTLCPLGNLSFFVVC